MVSYIEQTRGTMFLNFLALLLCFLMIKFTNTSLEEHMEKIKYYILETAQKIKVFSSCQPWDITILVALKCFNIKAGLSKGWTSSTFQNWTLDTSKTASPLRPTGFDPVCGSPKEKRKCCWVLSTQNFSCSPVQSIQLKTHSEAFCMSKILALEPQFETIGNEAGHQRDICTPVFTAALFTTAKTWKQPEHLSTDEWVQKIERCCMEHY